MLVELDELERISAFTKAMDQVRRVHGVSELLFAYRVNSKRILVSYASDDDAAKTVQFIVLEEAFLESMRRLATDEGFIETD